MPSRASKNARQQRKDQHRHDGPGTGTYTPDPPSLSGSPAMHPWEINDTDTEPLDAGRTQEYEALGEEEAPIAMEEDSGAEATWPEHADVAPPAVALQSPPPEESRTGRGKKRGKGKKDAGGVLDELRRNGLLGAQTEAGEGAEEAWPGAEAEEGARSPILTSLGQYSGFKPYVQPAPPAAYKQPSSQVPALSRVPSADGEMQYGPPGTIVAPAMATKRSSSSGKHAPMPSYTSSPSYTSTLSYTSSSPYTSGDAPSSSSTGSSQYPPSPVGSPPVRPTAIQPGRVAAAPTIPPVMRPTPAAHARQASRVDAGLKDPRAKDRSATKDPVLHGRYTKDRSWQESMEDAFRGEALGMEETMRPAVSGADYVGWEVDDDVEDLQSGHVRMQSARPSDEYVLSGAGFTQPEDEDVLLAGEYGQSPGAYKQSGVARSLRDGSPAQHVRRSSAYDRPPPVRSPAAPAHYRTASSPNERPVPTSRTSAQHRRGSTRSAVPDIDTLLDRSRDTIRGKAAPHRGIRSPREDVHQESIRSAQWCTIGSRRMLVLVYGKGVSSVPDVDEYAEYEIEDVSRGGGLQIWDCTDLAGVREVLSIDGRALAETGDVAYAAPLPLRPGQHELLLGVLLTELEASTLVVYSLVSHEVVQRARLSGRATYLEASRDWIVVGIAAPKAELLVLSATTLDIITVIPGAGLHLTLPSHVISPSRAEKHEDGDHVPPQLLEPVFALSGRLLAYATAPPDIAPASTTSFASISTVTAPADLSLASGLGSAATGLSHLVGRAARGETTREELARTRDDLARAGASMAGAGVSVAGSVLSGLRGMLGEEGGRGGMGRLFSRGGGASAAPAQEKGVKESGQQRVSGSPPTVPTTMPRAKTEGYGVTVVDLGSLLSQSAGRKGKTEHPLPRLAATLPSPAQPISRICFNAEGTQLLAARADGTSAAVWAISPDVQFHAPEQKQDDTKETASLVYTLRRGRTAAVLDASAWAWDGRWVALGSKRRTVHVFATMPYGGLPDGYSHVEGRVRNAASLQPLGVEAHPIVRLRFARMEHRQLAPLSDRHPMSSSANGDNVNAAPLAIVFLRASEQRNLPPTLQPASPLIGFAPSTSAGRLSVSAGRSSGSFGRFTPSTSAGRFTPSTSAGRPTSVLSTSTGSDAPLSPRGQVAGQRTTNFQDVLVFDPADGTLSLRRITTELRPREASGMAVSIAGASISLPGLGGLGRTSSMGASKSGAPGISPASSQSGGREEAQMVLSATEDVVATWRVRRDTHWTEVRERVPVETPQIYQRRVVGAKDALALAELSTFPRAPAMLPRTIYLAHQFTFRALGEDYHALLRQYRFTANGPVINVRHEVVARPGAVDGFVEGMGGMDDVEPESASFDAPLAHALAADVGAPVQTVLPMLPNGRPRSFMNGIPSLPARAPIPIRVPSLSARPATHISRRASGGGGNRTSFIAVTDRVSEGIRRGYSKIRSPSFGPASVDESVPLEFDEEDEDFAPRVFEGLEADDDEEFEEFPEASRQNIDILRDGRRARHAEGRDDDVLIPDLDQGGAEAGDWTLRAKGTTDVSGHAAFSLFHPSSGSSRASSAPRHSSRQRTTDYPVAANDETWAGWDVEDASTIAEQRFDGIAAAAVPFNDHDINRRMPGHMFEERVDDVEATPESDLAMRERVEKMNIGAEGLSTEPRKKKQKKKQQRRAAEEGDFIV